MKKVIKLDAPQKYEPKFKRLKFVSNDNFWNTSINTKKSFQATETKKKPQNFL